ncbi:MAG: rod shape-determining protein RodA [Candidatus Marinimicrobia bacterium]|nr:rod shape-determining protein RodA [Candidatus Neomarinimicrobiota bacterium]
MLSRTKLFANKFSELDYFSLFIVLILNIIGLAAIYSATSYTGSDIGFSHPFIKQLITLFAALFFLVFLFSVKKAFLESYALIFYIVGILLIIAPFFIGGTDATNTNRWFDLGFFRFQPSEFMKFFLIIMLAHFFSSTKISPNRVRYALIPLAIALLPTGIVFLQPDLGTSLVYMAIFMGILFSAGTRLYHIFLIVAPIITILAAFNITTFFIWGIIIGIIVLLNNANIWKMVSIFFLNIGVGLITPLIWGSLKAYQKQRIITLFNANLDPQGAGYQVLQSQIAIGSGGLKGKGFMNGTQTHLRFLPEQHTDFIFSVIAEEFGFIFVSIIFFLFLMLIIKWQRMAFSARDKFGTLIIIGSSTALLFHIFINVGMTIGIMPVTGKPLPFISYGGSFLITCYGLLALILNGNSEQIPQKDYYS